MRVDGVVSSLWVFTTSISRSELSVKSFGHSLKVLALKGTIQLAMCCFEQLT
jgi:hypothetical protein